MNENELVAVLNELGADGIQAFYVYLALEYISVWLLVGLCAWGAYKVWDRMKDELDKL